MIDISIIQVIYTFLWLYRQIFLDTLTKITKFLEFNLYLITMIEWQRKSEEK